MKAFTQPFSRSPRNDRWNLFNLDPHKYFIASTHREENVDSSERLQQPIDPFSRFSKKYKKRILFFINQGTQARIQQYKVNKIQKINHLKCL
jgi:UDP-N-acetylglucosamine 2-epimerase